MQIFLAATLSAAGGIGGGGLFVPLLVLLFRFSAAVAVTLSNILIVGTSLANFVQMVRRKLPGAKYSRPLIDYNMALALQPSQLAGTVIGVVLNKMFPDWLVLILLIIVMLISVRLFHPDFESFYKIRPPTTRDRPILRAGKINRRPFSRLRRR